MTILEKQPSPELLSLIKAAAQSLLGFGELWGAIKAKGADEGFKETDLQDMLRPLLRDRLGMSKDKIYYLFHQEQEKERSKSNRYLPTINVDKVIEQSPISEELPPNAPTKTSEQFYKEQQKPFERTEALGQAEVTKEQLENEEPTELEFANIKIAQLEDALHKTEQFKPATALEDKRLSLDETAVFEFLSKRDNGVNIYYFDNYGRELFSNRILSQLKNSGVKTFKRLYFEV